MQNVLGSYDSEKYKKILRTLKEEQKIIRLEELIDNERMIRKQLEQEAKLILTQIQILKSKKKDGDKYRSSSLYKYYEDKEFKEKAYVRNTLMSTSYKD
jgi:hypothetical protein